MKLPAYESITIRLPQQRDHECITHREPSAKHLCPCGVFCENGNHQTFSSVRVESKLCKIFAIIFRNDYDPSVLYHCINSIVPVAVAILRIIIRQRTNGVNAVQNNLRAQNRGSVWIFSTSSTSFFSIVFLVFYKAGVYITQYKIISMFFLCHGLWMFRCSDITIQKWNS